MIHLNEAGVPLNSYWGPRISDGARDLRLWVCSWTLEREHLILFLRDADRPVELRLHYRLHEQQLLERWCEISSADAAPVVLENCASAQFSLPGTGYAAINFTGRWSGEFQQQSIPIASGRLVWESLCGLTGHQCAPAFVVHKNADEEHGAVWFGVLAHAGNFKITAEDVCAQSVNIVAGISDTDFSWTLEQGESFETPHLYAGYAQGLGAMSRRLHRFAREVLLPRPLAEKPLPVLYNCGTPPSFRCVSSSSWRWRGKLPGWAWNCSSWMTAGSKTGTTAPPGWETGHRTQKNSRRGLTR